MESRRESSRGSILRMHPLTCSTTPSEMPIAQRNSSKSIGYIWTFSSEPTGMEATPFVLRPIREPDATMSKFSLRERNFSAVRAFGQSWISSRKSSVLPGTNSKRG